MHSHSLLPNLPGFDGVNRVEQHDDIQNQAVFDPEDQDQFGQHKEGQGAAEAKLPGQPEAQGAAGDVAQRIDDGIAGVTQGQSGFAVAVDDKGGVFHHLPGRLDEEGQHQPPLQRQARPGPGQQPEKDKAVQDVGEAVRIGQMLRVIGTPDVAGPQPHLAAGAHPQPSLAVKEIGGEDDNGGDG